MSEDHASRRPGGEAKAYEVDNEYIVGRIFGLCCGWNKKKTRMPLFVVLL